MSYNYPNQHQHPSMQTYFPNHFQDTNSNFPPMSYLHLEILNIKKTLQNVVKENESLKTIVINLQNELLNKRRENSSTPRNEDSETTKAPKSMESKENRDWQPKKNSFAPKTWKILSPKAKVENLMTNDPQSTICEESIEEDFEFKSPQLNIKFEESISSDDEEEPSKKIPIKRRNGFKAIEDEKAKLKRSAAQIDQQRSKAKHLWITYGRKIVDYAVDNSRGPLKERIKDCSKLVSKKGFSEVFLVRSKDKEDDIIYKRDFGKLALEFFENEVENAFLNSNYREDLLAQREKVLGWIERQINGN